MHTELNLRRDELEGEMAQTVYFGGGSPSLLSGDEMKRLMETIMNIYPVAPDAEITLEANPDDITSEKVKAWMQAGINRLSIGIQSFRDEDLEFMNRAHTASQADYSVKTAQDIGITNITIDLIYSIPGMSEQAWQQNLDKAVSLNLPHISAYSLTFEPGTVFGVNEKKGKLRAVDQEISAAQFLKLSEFLRLNGYDHYEVSNFGRPGYYSRHNTSYWNNERYLGIGPSAHSYNGFRRQWNVSNNPAYTRSLMEGRLSSEGEDLSESARINEYIMTRLRTMWGLDLGYLETTFGYALLETHAHDIDEHLRFGRMIREGSILRLTTEGMLMADRIASDFFILEK